MSRKRVFVSHSSFKDEERKFLDAVLTNFSGQFDVLADRTRLHPGDLWRNEIYSWMGLCDAAVILLGESAKREDSKWVPRESMVLRWRRQLDSRIELIPVYLPGFSRPDLDQRPFDDLGLEDLQAETVENWSEAAAAIERVANRLAAALLPLCTLERGAERVLAYLEKVSRSTIEEALKKVPIELGKWDSDLLPEKKLAVRLAHFGISTTAVGCPGVEALQVLRTYTPTLPRDHWEELIDLLACSWVDPCTAPYFCRFQPGSARPVLVLNAKERDTLRQYVARACVGDTVASWPTLDILPGAGEGEEEKDLKEQVMRTYAAGLRKITPANRDARVRAALAARAAAGEPVFFSITADNHLPLGQLATVQEGMPPVTFVFICGEQFPTAACACPKATFVKPELEPGMEDKAAYEQSTACDRVCRP